MKISHRLRRIIAVATLLSGVAAWLIVSPKSYETEVISTTDLSAEPNLLAQDETAPLATDILAKLEIKGRAPKTGYQRTEFYNGWPTIDGCSLRQRIIKRDFGDSAVLDPTSSCNVIAGEYDEPYTGQHQVFTQREDISKNVQIDHVVALSDAWQKGAQYKTQDERYQIATDPLNLIAVDGSANQQKSDGDAATWLPSNKKFRCAYVARQVSVKYKYALWVTQAEHDAIAKILEQCPNEHGVGVTF
ncbi:HNH endonuclease [Candidatus Saccharibacteria bacterium]|nr:HNH endonuclease [Candidatus Saccharibacteria bacterium]